jgi:hypothetical protein
MSDQKVILACMDWQEILFSEYFRVFCTALAIPLAYLKGRRIILWSIITYMFSFLGLAILLLRAKLPKKNYPLWETVKFRVKEYRTRKKIRKLETPEDFLKG